MSAPLMHLDVDDLTSMNGGEPLPAWAVKILDAHNRNVDALSELQQRAGGAVQKQISFTTKTPAADTFDPPMRVAVGFAPSVVKIGRVVDVNDPSSTITAAAFPDWSKVEGGILIAGITGLADGRAYRVTLELSP